MKMALFLIVFASGAAACTEKLDTTGYSISMPSGNIQLAEELQNHEAAVLFFLSPECPLCRDYAPRLRELKWLADSLGMLTIAVLSGTAHEAKEMKGFLESNRLDFFLLENMDAQLADDAGIDVTPSAVLVDKTGEILYRGAIDNWAVSLGRKRILASEHYLQSAMYAAAQGRPANPKETKAIGCFIE